MIHLSVIIVNYKTPDLVLNCVQSLLPQLAAASSRVTIVDNDSQDGSCEAIRAWILKNGVDGQVQLIVSPRNSGFAVGNNTGIRSCRARLYLLLNSDTLVRDGAVEKLLAVAQQYPDAGVIGPRLEDLDGEPQSSCFRYHTPISELCDAAQTGLIDKLFAKFVVALPPQNEACEPQWISFACVLVRNEVIEEVGFLDEGYFMYFEDAEFCYRVKRNEWRILHEPAARIVHFHSKSSGVGELSREKHRLPRYFYESRTRYYYQRFGMIGLLMANLMRLLGRSIAGLRRLTGRPDKSPIAWEWLDIWANFSRPLGGSHLDRH